MHNCRGIKMIRRGEQCSPASAVSRSFADAHCASLQAKGYIGLNRKDVKRWQFQQKISEKEQKKKSAGCFGAISSEIKPATA